MEGELDTLLDILKVREGGGECEMEGKGERDAVREVVGGGFVVALVEGETVTEGEGLGVLEMEALKLSLRESRGDGE